ncbi:alpha/beta fold hydrolase [Microbacterium sp. SLBN-111]|uniref:alpha/beta fold hydrolase n=1 Tax=Microbacterium sp. SLBN-111 TaxID=3377733 RepID=UPI003C79362A
MPSPRRALMTHGFASSWEHGWVQHGWPDLLAEIDILPVPFGLPGHVDSPLPPTADIELVRSTALDEAAGADTAIGFSLGAALTLHLAAQEPERFERIVLLGFGDRAWPRPGENARLADRLADPARDDADIAQLRRAARTAGNDLSRIEAFLRHFPGPPPPSRLRAITADVLIILGERDDLGPATMAATSMTNTQLRLLPDVDHWRTPSSPAAMRAAVEFLS